MDGWPISPLPLLEAIPALITAWRVDILSQGLSKVLRWPAVLTNLSLINVFEIPWRLPVLVWLISANQLNLVEAHVHQLQESPLWVTGGDHGWIAEIAASGHGLMGVPVLQAWRRGGRERETQTKWLGFVSLFQLIPLCLTDIQEEVMKRKTDHYKILPCF